MAAMLSQVQCMQIYNPEKRESLLCERRGDGPTEAAATATEAATAPGAVRDGAGEERQGETESVRDSSTSRERGD